MNNNFTPVDWKLGRGSVSDLGTLRELLGNAHDSDIDIVLIPGFGTPPVESWPFCSDSWLSACLPQAISRARLLAFDYVFPLDDSFSWENIWLQGDQFIKKLSEARKTDGCTEDIRPMIFVCHSLGGLILKQALCIANEQLYRYEHLVNATSGIIFMSTPHFGPDQPDPHDKVMSILKATSKVQIKPTEISMSTEVAVLTDLSLRFDAVRILTPILSMFETQETRLKEGRFKHKKVLLVDQPACTLNAPNEKFLAMPFDHSSICQFAPDDGGDEAGKQSRDQIIDFIRLVLVDAKQSIEERLEAMKFRYTTTTTYSPTHSAHSLQDLQNEGNRESSSGALDTGAATHGSSAAGGFEIVSSPSSTGISYSSRLPKLPCIMLEYTNHNPDFFGREGVLQQIAKALLPSQTKFVSSESEDLKRFAICGLGGVGKTEIAVEFALRYKDAYDAVFWIRADEVSKLDSRFSQIAVELQLETATESTSHVVSRDLVKGWLSKPWKWTKPEGEVRTAVEATWLMVFDNADDPQILPDYWPIQGSGSVLITSRDPLSKSIFARTSSGVDLEPFSNEEGATLLKQLTDEQDTEHIAEDIAQVLGGLPLAISQMAGIIRRQELKLSEFLESYNDATERATLFGSKFPVGHSVYPHTISSVWVLDSLTPTTRNLLQVIAFLDPDSIQEYVLTNFSGDLMLAGYPFSPAAFKDARTELLQASLIVRHKDRKELTVHRLVQESVRAKMTPDESMRTFWSAVQLLWAKWPTAMGSPTRKGAPVVTPKFHFIDRWPTCAALYPHVLRLRNLYGTLENSNPMAPKVDFAALLNDAAWWQFERGKTRNFSDFWTLAQKLCEESHQENDREQRDSLLVDMHFCQGAIAAETNDPEGSRHHKKEALDLQLAVSKRLDTIDIRLARSYHEYAIALIDAGDYQSAIEHIDISLNIDKKLGAYPYNWNTETNLGLAYTLKGDLEAADEVLVGTLQRREERYGKNDTESFRPGRILHALGDLRAAQGRLEESFEFHKRSLASFEATIGKNQHRYADLCHLVAEHHIRHEEYDKALTLTDHALSTWEYHPDVYRQEIARTTYLKASIFYTLGKEMKAKVLLKRAKALRKAITNDLKADDELGKKDFDCLVAFWSR
ncbi:tetratricopeptide repeat domain containing protein [Hyaloscypha variabilis]